MRKLLYGVIVALMMFSSIGLSIGLAFQVGDPVDPTLLTCEVEWEEDTVQYCGSRPYALVHHEYNGNLTSEQFNNVSTLTGPYAFGLHGLNTTPVNYTLIPLVGVFSDYTLEHVFDTEPVNYVVGLEALTVRTRIQLTNVTVTDPWDVVVTVSGVSTVVSTTSEAAGMGRIYTIDVTTTDGFIGAVYIYSEIPVKARIMDLTFRILGEYYVQYTSYYVPRDLSACNVTEELYQTGFYLTGWSQCVYYYLTPYDPIGDILIFHRNATIGWYQIHEVVDGWKEVGVDLTWWILSILTSVISVLVWEVKRRASMASEI